MLIALWKIKNSATKIFSQLMPLKFLYIFTEFLIPLIEHNILISLSCQVKIRMFPRIQE